MSTGPRTPNGKNQSSGNALTHGCCSEKFLLKGENEAQWLQLQQSWLDDYQPETATFANLLLDTANAEWLLRRVAGQYDAVQQSLNEDPLQWTEADHQRLERFSRYRTTAERRFMRFRQAVEQTRKNRELEAHRKKVLELTILREEDPSPRKNSKVRPAAPEPEPEPAASAPPAKPFDPFGEIKVTPCLRQSVDIRVENGTTTTVVQPSNDKLLEQSKTKNPPAEIVIRMLCFWNGFPPEYQWAINVGTFVSNVRQQVLTFAQWLTLIERERVSGTPHVLPLTESEDESDETN